MTTPRREAAAAFVRRVRTLNRGQLAALKRNAGTTLREARGVMWFYGLLDAQHRWNAEVSFLVATLMSLNDYQGVGDFGHAMRRLAAVSGQETVDRRFRILLDSQFGLVAGGHPGGGELAYRLRQLVKLAAAREIGVDWARLLLDLRQWTHPRRWVQHRWAESFCAPRDDDYTQHKGAHHVDRDALAAEPCPIEPEPG